MFRRSLLARGLVSLLFLNSASAQGNAPAGAECDSDGDCAGNLDCIRTGVFEKRCFAITCAKGAAQAILDFGFDSDSYINKVMNDAGFASKTDFIMMDGDHSTHLSKALAVDVPPMHVFNENFTACMNPANRLRRLTDGQLFPDGKTTYGLQWSTAALFSYFGKSTWTTNDEILNPGIIQLLSNCFGFLLGADAGVDFLIQIFSDPNSLDNGSNSTTKTEQEFNPGDTQYVPIVTAGPFGFQVGWFQSTGPTNQTILEITFGTSFGIALGGFSQCSNVARVETVL
jgi:hypothetical protein